MPPFCLLFTKLFHKISLHKNALEKLKNKCFVYFLFTSSSLCLALIIKQVYLSYMGIFRKQNQALANSYTFHVLLKPGSYLGLQESIRGILLKPKIQVCNKA